MGKQSYGKLIGYLPVAIVVTAAVVVAPMFAVIWLRESGAVSSVWASTAIGVVLSLVVSQVGTILWKRTDSEVLFSELLLWGWIQRWRSERRLSAAADLLGLTAGRPEAISGGRLTNEQKTGLLTQLTSGLEARDQYTHGHSRRVARHAANIAKRMGLPREEVAKIRAAGAMHDVGKVETPAEVLKKTGKLTDEEYAIVKRHPVDGAQMVSMLDDDELTDIVRHHHERLDGTGYPDGLAGEEIPLGARILAVADTFDAITSTRPYRHANPHKKALDILSAEAGTQLDPDAVAAFLSCYSGRRPLAYWTMAANLRPRLGSVLGEGLVPAHAVDVLGTAATAAAVGAAIVPLAGASAEPSRRPAADAGAIARVSSARPAPRGIAPATTMMAAFRATRPDSADASDAAETSGQASPRGADPKAPQRASRVGGRGIPRPLPANEKRTTNQEPAATPQPAGKPDEGSSGQPTPGTNRGRGHGQAHGNGRGKGNGPGHGQSQGKANGQGQANGVPQGNGNANGHAYGQGHGNGNANGQGNGVANGLDKVTGQGKKSEKVGGRAEAEPETQAE